MKTRSSIILLVMLVGGLILVNRENERLVHDRKEYGITQADPLINAPPLVVFTTVALGGFRGIIADLLWMRSARLQSEGKYFELVQLADWITKLEPRFTEVWAYHAWNLAYNISVLFPDQVDRWRWVRHGFMMLRDEGLLYNPSEPRLLYELGWIFQHKIGGNADDAHMYYKQSWAAEMQQLFGGGRPSYDRLMSAAANQSDLMNVPGMREFTDQLKESGIAPFHYRALDTPQNHPAYNTISSSSNTEAWVSFLIRQKLIQAYKLDPVIMQEIEIKHGPLDWRLPQAHAIYWATLSRKYGRDEDDVFSQRMIYQCMADAFRRGKLSTGSDGSRFILSPALELLPFVMASYEEAMNNHAEKGTAIDGYRNFLHETIVLLYMYNLMPDAKMVFAKLNEIDPSTVNVDMMDYIFTAYTEKGVDMNEADAYASVESALYQSAFWKMMGDTNQAAGYEELAKMVWDRYMEPRIHNHTLNKRTGIPPLEEIREQAVIRAEKAISAHP